MAQCGFTATSAYYLNNTTHVHTQSAHAKAYATTCIIFLDIFLVGSVKRFGSSRSSTLVPLPIEYAHFLLVLGLYINFGHILHSFRDIASFFVLVTPPPLHPNFGCVLVGRESPDRRGQCEQVLEVP